MRRWNGWGETGVTQTLSAEALAFLGAAVGDGKAPVDATLDAVLATVPEQATAPDGAKVDPETRLRHACGQSFPDWVALRSGRLGRVPEAVVLPQSGAQVKDCLRQVARLGWQLVPYGGGTSVVGQLTIRDERPALCMDLRRLSDLKWLEADSQLACFGAGVSGPELEASLRAHRLTLGHYPQSFELSTLGGWIATRSSGQQSLGYGRIEQLFAGGRMESPAGPLVLPPYPASAAGQDLREIVLGSEGRLGVITEAIVRVRPLPKTEEFGAWFFPDWDSGRTAARELAQARLPLTMLRFSSATETDTTLRLAGHPRLVATLDKYLRLRRMGVGRCLLIAGVAGATGQVATTKRRLARVTRRHGGVSTGTALGSGWHKNRFRAPYLRNTLWEAGYGVDTVETAVTWDKVDAMMRGLEDAATTALRAHGERAHVFTHLSHLYPQGSSLYTTIVFRLAADADDTLARWRELKRALSEAVVGGGGTISHQHGVGVDHRPYLKAEKGPLGLAAMDAVCAPFDPDGIMIPR